MKLQRWDFIMGRKAKYSKEQKVHACEDYLNGRKTARQIVVELNMSKYEFRGEDGLEDRRGKRKSEEQLTDLEKAQQRIAKLERINRRQEMELELLKKGQNKFCPQKK